MSDRIDDYLEGTVGRGALTPRQRADAEAAGLAIEDARAFLGSRPTPDLTGAVMRRIDRLGLSEPAPRGTLLARIGRRLWVPRQVSIRPAYALVAAGACALLLWFVLVPSPASTRQPAPPTANDERVFVQFRLETDAARVQLAGSFTNWELRYDLHQASPGVWTITVPLSAGVHDYAFIVDGQHWIPDPYAAHISDGFGGTNSRLTLLSPETPRL